ncbi:MAG: fasciclin domain-containing protein [Siphonobacter aquaeclarae]|jgi:uncharacterized surface protein with fasciclin (FAS1) repeats|nr:fasciclin domain-containing protein [Siphonobacter aquaeclarae]
MKTIQTAALLLIAGASFAQVKPAAISMNASRAIVDNVVQSPALSDFLGAIKQTGVSNTLTAAGPFTVFAPVDSAFNALPDAEKFLSKDNTTALRKVMFHHVVTGKWLASNLDEAIKKNGGKTQLRTLTGQALYVTKKGTQFVVSDEKGNSGVIQYADQPQKNGVVHVINTVLFPK